MGARRNFSIGESNSEFC